jgi:NAD(P)-dependent dehydrogenase (short-subunit alcohol dehydrogenase family)
LDATSESGIKAICEDAISRYGRLDVMVANAGVAAAKHFKDTSAEEFMENVKVNLLSVFLSIKHSSAAMLKTSREKPYPSGSIICTASVAGLRSNAGSSSYSAAKAGVVSLVQTSAYQLAGTGIRVNAVCPGIIESGMTIQMYEQARKRQTEGKIGQLCPLKRGGVADEVARVVAFLGSEESSYMNGAAVPVDGGLSAGHPYVQGKLA